METNLFLAGFNRVSISRQRDKEVQGVILPTHLRIRDSRVGYISGTLFGSLMMLEVGRDQSSNVWTVLHEYVMHHQLI